MEGGKNCKEIDNASSGTKDNQSKSDSVTEVSRGGGTPALATNSLTGDLSQASLASS
jgi:hypothetical protein